MCSYWYWLLIPVDAPGFVACSASLVLVSKNCSAVDVALPTAWWPESNFLFERCRCQLQLDFMHTEVGSRCPEPRAAAALQQRFVQSSRPAASGRGIGWGGLDPAPAGCPAPRGQTLAVLGAGGRQPWVVQQGGRRAWVSLSPCSSKRRPVLAPCLLLSRAARRPLGGCFKIR